MRKRYEEEKGVVDALADGNEMLIVEEYNCRTNWNGTIRMDIIIGMNKDSS